MGNVLKGDKENFQNLINSDKLSVVDLWAEWCGPCRIQLPILEEFAKNNPDVQVVKLNVDENQELASSFGVRSIPTLIFFKNGEEKRRVVGVQNIQNLTKAKEELI